jgi:hypothetical protein
MTKKVLQICAALLVLALGAGFMTYRWGVEARNKPDKTYEFIYLQQNQAASARWVLSLMPKLSELEARLAGLQPGTPEYARVAGELTEARNLVAAKVPTLATGYDAQGNAQLRSLDDSTRLLGAIVEAARNQKSNARRQTSEDERLRAMPIALHPYDARTEYLVRGWYEPELGLGVRFTGKVAVCEIKNDDSKKYLVLSLLYPESLGTAAGAVYVNDQKVGSFSISSGSPVQFQYSTPPGAGDVLRVRIVNDVLAVPDELQHNGDKRPLGVAVIAVSQQ